MSEEVQQSQKATPEKPSSTNNDQQESKIEDKKLTELNGEIGYFVKKGTQFVPVTNFSVVCTGYVTENSSCGSSDGFLFKVLPKSTLHNEESNPVEESFETQYYLTWRDMSTQTGIVSAFNSKKLWTVPSKEQYLPAYFKRLCDSYLRESNPRRLFPVECIGLQQGSDPLTWVIGSNLHVHIVDGVTSRVQENDSPYAVLGSELTPLPMINIKDDDNLDGGEVIREIIKVEQEFMGNNFVPAVLMIGGMGLALHYEDLAMKYDGAPLIMAYGLPVSGKSLAVSIAMAIIGEHTSIGECTQAGILKLSCSRTLPFWWDDVSDLNTLEALAVQAYNQSQRQTAKNEKASIPRSIPMMTMNPQCIFGHRKGKVDKEKISRTFSRIVTIPFNKISGIQTLQGSLSLKAALQPLLSKAVLSIGTLLELGKEFQVMQETDLFKEICTILEGSSMDMRSQLNYALVLFSTGKILEKLGLEEYFTQVKTYFVNSILPSVHGLLNEGESATSHTVYSPEEEQEFNSLIEKIVVQCTASPHQVKSFFLPKATMKTKCKCGDVFGFKVSEAMKFIGCREREQVLKTFVTASKQGCVGRLTFPIVGQCAGCLHIQRLLLPRELLRKMDEAFHSERSGPTTSAKTTMENADTEPNLSRPTNAMQSQQGPDMSVISDKDAMQSQQGPDMSVISDKDAMQSQQGPDMSVISDKDAMQSQQGPDMSVISDDDDSEEEKTRLDAEILAKEAERAEVEEQAKGKQARKTGKKGRKRNEVFGLQDTLHPGNVLEKRRRVSKK